MHRGRGNWIRGLIHSWKSSCDACDACRSSLFGRGGGVDGVEWWRRMVVTGVFDAEGTDVEVPLCAQL